MNPSSRVTSVPFSRPVLGPEEEQAVVAVLRSGWLTTGPQAQAFETEFADYAGTKFALAVNSATAGLHLALEALGVGPGDVCAVPDYTFTATAEVVRYQGADPVFLDCSPHSPNFDPQRLEDLLKKQRVKVVIPVHLTGEPFDSDALSFLQNRYGFAVLEDAAHMIPSRRPDGRLWGAGSDIGVYSFYANKNMTTGEGGMIVTDNEAWALRMRRMRLHGIDRDAFDRFTSPRSSWAYQIVAPGFKYNMTDVAAAIGRVQLTKAESFWKARQRLVRRYIDSLASCQQLELPRWREDHAWHVFSPLLTPALSARRDRFVQELTQRGVGVSVHYTPLHRMQYWRETYGLSSEAFPHSASRGERTFSLPLYPSMTDAQQEFVLKAVIQVHQQMNQEVDSGLSP
ncbi:MAG: DegT/DnrJ/EryC1/StrS family aminotransferase [Spirochaetales bacterium]|nr:DegT/DnrJ/EryC1/StrS family aminotransferase [Spirochaetales bacterium]